MNDEREERGLRDLFAQQRADESARTPSFGATLASARRRDRRVGVRRTMWLVGAAAAVAVIAVVMLMMPRRAGEETRRMTAELSSVEWRAPTDFLLETPGAELMRTTPRIVRPEDMSLPALEREHNRGGERR